MPKIEILAHRGIGFGKPENSVAAIAAALTNGVGLEIDLRWGKNHKPVISHDPPADNAPTFDEILPELLRSAHPIAIHVKEDVSALCRAIAGKVRSLGNLFVFDVRIEDAQDLKAGGFPLPLGFSVSESKYLPSLYDIDTAVNLRECDIVWWDEWTLLGSVYNQSQRDKIRKAGKRLYAISPELHRTGKPIHEFSKDPSEAWKRLIELDVDGICTDLPLELAEMLS